MKTSLSAPLLAHYASETTSLARLLKLTRTDGAAFGFTDHDRPIRFEGLRYGTLCSFDASAAAAKADLSIATLEISGLLMIGGITAAGIEAGLWDGASADIVEVNHRDLTMGCNPLSFGVLGEAQRKSRGEYTIEVRGLNYYLQNNLGRTVTAACPWDLGSVECGFDLESLRITGTVGVVTSNRVFKATYVAPAPIETYGIGEITWLTGANAGLPMEMKVIDVAGLHTLQLDMPYDVALGDTFSIVPGCNKIGRAGHCKMVYDRYSTGFGGFEDIPGQNKITLVGGQ